MTAEPDILARLAGGLGLDLGFDDDGAATALIAAAPSVLIEAVAGLALLGAFAGSLNAAIAVPEYREAAVITFLTSASGLTIWGIGGAFWGLVAGGAMLLLGRIRR